MDKFLNPEEFNIDNIFKGKYSIPIYQRPYSWGKEEVIQLLNDIEKTYRLYNAANIDSKNIHNEEMLLFTGTLFIKTEKNIKNTYTEYDIVDGQQRITTITLILMVLLNYFYKIESEDDAVKDIENYLWKKVDRKREKETRVLTLGNIDKKIMIQLFDRLFSKNDIIEFAKEKINDSINDVEKNLLNNLIIIYEYLDNFKNEDEYYEYFEYIKYNIRFIAIEVHTNLVKLFSIFESINSKGKPLEDIDLIKSYIFQNIEEDDYDEYLQKWGQLIVETNDNLMEYVTIYVRANISYYRNSIKLFNFKTLVQSGFNNYYNTDNTREIVLHFIDDMLDNVKYYKMLYDTDMLERMNLSKKIIVYFMMNNIMDYNHTKALYFKLLVLYDKNKLSEETFIKVIKSAFSFILTFQSICSRESKQTIGVFIDVQGEIYKKISSYNNKENLSLETFQNLIDILNKKIIDSSINDETIKRNIRSSVTYTTNKKAVKIMLNYLEYMDEKYNVDFDKLFWLLKLGKSIHIDHILPLSPNKNDDNFKYYVEENNVILKKGQDFTDNNELIIGKEEFYDDYLHVFGNLRLEWANDNIKKSNKLIQLREFDYTFNSSSQISMRTSSLIKKIIQSDFLITTDKIDYINKSVKDNELYIINEFDDKIEYKDYIPVSFELLGERYILNKNKYKQLMYKIMGLFFDLEAEKFIKLAKEKYMPMESDRIYISTDKQDIRDTYLLGKNVYIETNLASKYIIKFIYIVVREIGLSSGDVKIFLRKK